MPPYLEICMLLNYKARRILKHTWIDNTHRAVVVVGFTTTCVISAGHHKRYEIDPVHDEAYSIQHYVIKVVSDLRQVGNFLLILWFPPPIKLTDTI